MVEKLLPFAVFPSFLPKAEHRGLVEFALGRGSEFVPATIRAGDSSVVNTGRRLALVSRDLGGFRPLLQNRFLAILPAIMQSVGSPEPPPTIIELEMAAHGDGAFYQRHTDLPIGVTRENRCPEPDRVLSAVYYFYAEPKRFSGGQLRLFNLDNSAFIDIEPTQNQMIVFHSWVAHEVRTVSCPSGEFGSSRFAINCWYRRVSTADR